MLKWLRQLLISALVFLPLALFAQQGPESGGGGGVLMTSSGPRLVDFYNIQGGPEQMQIFSAGRASSKMASPLLLSFNREDRVSDPAFLEVLRLFSRWSEVPFDTIGVLINGAIYRPLLWDFTRQSVMAPPSHRPAALPADAVIRAAAYYLKRGGSFHVRLNLELWYQLPLADQAGLLMHETLRHVQIGLSQNFDDEALQKATAMMILCKPGVKLNQYLFFLLNNRRDLAEARFEPYDVLTQECGK